MLHIRANKTKIAIRKAPKILDFQLKKNGGNINTPFLYCRPVKHAAILLKNFFSVLYEIKKIVNWLCRTGRPWLPAMESRNAEGSEYCTSQFSQVQLPRSITLFRASFLVTLF